MQNMTGRVRVNCTCQNIMQSSSMSHNNILICLTEISFDLYYTYYTSLHILFWVFVPDSVY